MNDREIQTLIRMAGEAADLEAGREGHAPVFRIQPKPAVSLWRVGALSAAAAAVLLAGVVSLRMAAPNLEPVRAGPKMFTDRTARQPAAIEQVSAKQGCVVLTMFRDGDACNCVQMRTHEFSGKLEEVPRSELINMALEAPCSTSAQRVVVLAVSGNKASLPRTREDAEALAARITASGATHSADVASCAYQAIPTLGPDASVVAETVAWKRTVLPMEPTATWALGR
jgi:hypothetical protein